MADRFEICLYAAIEAEAGWRQTVGQPIVRTKRGCYWDESTCELVAPDGSTSPLPTEPDGMAFDDDPHDTGGRTCVGITQVVYDAHCDGVGKPRGDVWEISDADIFQIYRKQYWAPLRCSEMPAGVDRVVFCMGINAGISVGARLLQRSLRISEDGHIGAVTLAATRQRDPAELIEAYTRNRDAFYRSLKVFWRFGEGWLARSAKTRRLALADVGGSAPAVPPPTRVAKVKAPKAPAPEKPTYTAELTTTALTGTGLTVSSGIEVAAALESVGSDPTLWQLALAMAKTGTFWVGLSLVISGALGLWRQYVLGKGGA